MRNTKHSLKSALCVVLTALLVFSAVFCVAAAENEVAQTGASGTVYFDNTSNWSNLHCYMWNDDGSQKNAEWPGQPMTQVEGNVWKYTTSTDYQNVIFNNGGNGQQTGDLQFPGDGQIYSNGNCGPYNGHQEDPTVAPSSSNPNPQPTNPPTPVDGSYVYCKNSASWGDVYCYMWKDGAGNNGEWPGKKMENIGDGVYRYEVTGSFNMIIFNSGSDANKTTDMSYPGANQIYDNKTNKWETYDTSPITVKSFGANMESPQYKGTDIMLTSDAVSTGGTVFCKYSVTASGKTTVVADYTTKKEVSWTPAAAGTYTITFDFKDNAGNENQRTATFEIKDDAGVIEPILKGVTPKPGQIQKGAKQTITVNAAGGNINTKLLFYKFQVEDPNGNIINTPYFSKAFNNVSFTPATTGMYKVTVYVQGSDNQTIERTYTYNSLTTIVPEPTEPTLPSQPEPTEPGDVTLKGDANSDGEVTVIDATLVQQVVAQIVSQDKAHFANSDVNGDSALTVLDATLIQRFVAKLEIW